MVKVSLEVRYVRARFMVTVKAQSIEQAMNLITARYPGSIVRVNFPIDTESFFVEDSAA